MPKSEIYDIQVLNQRLLCVGFINRLRVGRFGEKRMSGVSEGAEPRLVTPGAVIGPASGYSVGSGAVIENDNVISTKTGYVKEINNTISVKPLNASYSPQSGDLVIGVAVEARANLWFLDINGPFQALLPMSLAPWKVEYGATKEHADVGDIMVARVQEVDESHNVVATMKGVGLRKLGQGSIVTFNVNSLDDLRGEGGSMLTQIKEACDARVVIADNGRAWTDAEPEGVASLRSIVKFANENCHLSNFSSILNDFVNNIRGDN